MNACLFLWSRKILYKSSLFLDVFEKEPLTEQSELWNKENVILTPHNSFVGENNQERLWEVIYKNLKSIGK